MLREEGVEGEKKREESKKGKKMHSFWKIIWMSEPVSPCKQRQWMGKPAQAVCRRCFCVSRNYGSDPVEVPYTLLLCSQNKRNKRSDSRGPVLSHHTESGPMCFINPSVCLGLQVRDTGTLTAPRLLWTVHLWAAAHRVEVYWILHHRVRNLLRQGTTPFWIGINEAPAVWFCQLLKVNKFATDKSKMIDTSPLPAMEH